MNVTPQEAEKLVNEMLSSIIEAAVWIDESAAVHRIFSEGSPHREIAQRWPILGPVAVAAVIEAATTMVEKRLANLQLTLDALRIVQPQ